MKAEHQILKRKEKRRKGAQGLYQVQRLNGQHLDGEGVIAEEKKGTGMRFRVFHEAFGPDVTFNHQELLDESEGTTL